MRRFAFISLFFGGLSLVSFGSGIAQIAGIAATSIGGTGLLGEGVMNAKGIASSTVSAGQSVVYGVTGAILPSIGVPLIVAIISVPVIIAVIIFIINAGAYLVPPQAPESFYRLGTVFSPYIDISKVASPLGPFENSNLPKEIEYTVTIKAKVSTLTNIKIEESCNVIKEGSKLNCPAPSPSLPSPSDPNYPQSLSPTEQGFTFKYKATYSSPDFNDTLVINTIKVTADVPEQKGAMASNSASVKFGNPPEECPQGWPILPEGQESSLPITQGPLGGYSHYNGVEAIDVGATIGHTITARNSGVANVIETTGPYRPVYVTVTSTCGGVTFQSWYAHLSSVAVSDGQAVTMGQVLGNSGTDYPNNAHLHYEFRGIKMMPPFIPSAVPYYCSDNCGSIP